MAYTEDEQPSGLTALTTLENDDTVIVGDTSDPNEVVKKITWANVKTMLDALYQAVGSYLVAADIANFETTTQLNDRDTANRARANHTGTQTASTISDFDPEVSNNTDVAANTAARHAAATIGTANGLSIDGQAISLATATPSTPGAMSASDKTKLDGIESGAEVNNISDANATDLTDGGETTLHIHDGRYYTESEMDSFLAAKQDESVVVSVSLTATLDQYYVNVATATYSDPSPSEGKGFIVFVRNGTATVGGTGYSTAGTIIHRVFHSGSWSNYVYLPASSYYAPGGTDVALADGGTGASLTDPNADRIMFWDDSAGAVTWLTPSTGLTISGTNMTVRTASATQTGIVELATDAETVTGTDTARATTPANIAARLAAPGTIGGTTPGAATFTTMTATSVAGTAVSDTSGVNTGTSTNTIVTPDALAGSYAGTKSVQMVVVDFGTAVTTGDGKFYFRVPPALNGMDIVNVHAEVITAGTTGTTDIQLHNVTDAVDILSTKLTIDSGETGSDTAATAAVINTANDSLATNDIIRVDVDAVSTTAPEGLIVTFEARLP